jgi:hypothetical protein
MIGMLNNCAFVAAAAGAGPFTVAGALNGAQTPALAGAIDGTTYRYHAQSSDLTQWEYGNLVSSSKATMFARTVLGNCFGNQATVAFSQPPNVILTFLAADFFNGQYSSLSGLPTLGSASPLNVGAAAGNIPQLDGSARLPAVDGSQLFNIFPSGTSMLFVQSSAPPGWTKQTAQNDAALRVVSGSASTGGVNSFSATFSQTQTQPFTLTESELAAHNHTGNTAGNSVQLWDYNVQAIMASGGPYGVMAPQSHTHGIYYDGSSAAFSLGMDIRVQYVDCIICGKN